MLSEVKSRDASARRDRVAKRKGAAVGMEDTAAESGLNSFWSTFDKPKPRASNAEATGVSTQSALELTMPEHERADSGDTTPVVGWSKVDGLFLSAPLSIDPT